MRSPKMAPLTKRRDNIHKNVEDFTKKINSMSISQNSVSFVKCSWKSGQKSAFPHKSKVAFPKTEVLGKPRIKESILKNTSARYIYLFGSYAYGKPTDKSDIDIYLVLPDNADNVLEIYGNIMVDLGIKKIFFVDLLLVRESEFNIRKNEHLLERTVYQKGKMLYGH